MSANDNKLNVKRIMYGNEVLGYITKKALNLNGIKTNKDGVVIEGKKYTYMLTPPLNTSSKLRTDLILRLFMKSNDEGIHYDAYINQDKITNITMEDYLDLSKIILSNNLKYNKITKKLLIK